MLASARLYMRDRVDGKVNSPGLMPIRPMAEVLAVSAISEGLRQEASETVLDFYKDAIPAASVARAIAFAIEPPDHVDINQIVLRPTRQVF